MPVQDVIGFAFADGDQSVWIVGATHFIFDVLNQDLDGLSDFWWLVVFFPLAAADSAFALEAYIDNDCFAVYAYDFAFDDFVDVKFWQLRAFGGFVNGFPIFCEKIVELRGNCVVF